MPGGPLTHARHRHHSHENYVGHQNKAASSLDLEHPRTQCRRTRLDGVWWWRWQREHQYVDVIGKLDHDYDAGCG